MRRQQLHTWADSGSAAHALMPTMQQHMHITSKPHTRERCTIVESARTHAVLTSCVVMLRQFEAEMENFSQSSLALQRVAADVASSGRAIEHLKEQKAGAHPPGRPGRDQSEREG